MAKTILVIDDNTDLRENTAEILDLAGYKTLTAENGKRGVEVATREKPDVIVCDIMMPELDGYGVLHLLRKNPDTKNIPFIFLTAKTERSDFRKGKEMGRLVLGARGPTGPEVRAYMTAESSRRRFLASPRRDKE